jgi:endonuclease/exonuclease/phosphatase family metal-dependent hydrolase
MGTSWLMRVLNVLALPFFGAVWLGLLLSCLAPYVDPRSTTLFAFAGLAFPFLFLINLFFLIYWTTQLRKRALVSLLALLPALYFAGAYIQFGGKSLPADKEGIRIASLNAQLLGHHQGRNTAEEVADAMARELPTLVCMQEFLNKGRGDSSTVKFFQKRLHLPYAYFERLNDGRKYGQYGMLILSRYKQLRRGIINFAYNTGNMCIWADLLYGKDTVRVYNIHLQSIRFGRSDYRFIKQGAADNEKRLEGSRNILRRMHRAWKMRAEQVDSLKAHLAACPHPIILTGDFNDAPMSHAYHRLSQGLRDAFRESGSGLNRTYQGPFPSFRIDYLLHSAYFASYDYKTDARVPSDHKMIMGTLVH